MARISWSCNDVILLGALGYSAAVLFMKWSSYSLCRYPLHIYLLVDYTIIFLFRLAHLASQYFSDHSPCVQKFVNFIKIGFLYLFFVAWTIVGTVWFTFSSECFSEAHQYWTLIFWLGLCYVWIALYLCLIILQFTLRADPQLQHIGVLEGRSFLPSSLLLRLTEMSNQTSGLPQYRIDAIPLCDAPPPSLGQDSCAVCIEPFCKDDICKKLPSCPHYFHAPCIDSWLRRKDDCPVCRTSVVVPVDHTSVLPASGSSFRQLQIHPPLSPHLGGPDSFRSNFAEPTPTYAAPSSYITQPVCHSFGDTPLQPHRIPITDFVVCDNDLDMEIGADDLQAGPQPERSHSSTEVTDGYRSVSVPQTLHRLHGSAASPRPLPPFTTSRSLPNVYIDVATSDPDVNNGEIQQDPNPF